MSPFPWSDLVIIAGLIVLNGLFSMSELAIVSARPARLRKMSEDGSKGAKAALALAADSGKFLSTVQIGITLIGIVAGAYSGASLGQPVGERLAALGIDAELADELGFAVVIVLTTYFSLTVGELAPKQIALRGREKIASLAAPPMSILAKVARDRAMAELCARYPAYGFSRHKGYGTAAHAEALEAHGPCACHRKSFAPVRNALKAA